jgi:hypothetical protein
MASESVGLVQAARGLGLDAIVFIRHANAAPGSGLTRLDQPHDWKTDDQMVYAYGDPMNHMRFMILSWDLTGSPL